MIKLLFSISAVMVSMALNAQLVINEVCAANGYIIQDFENDYEDWLEIYNPTSTPVSLDGFYLETFDTKQKRWYFPNVVVKPDSCILVFCSGKDRKEIIDHYELPIFPFSSSWRYRIGTSEPNANWVNPGFDDSGWSSGFQSIGYGDGDDATVIAPTISYHARDTFSLTSTDQFIVCYLAMDYDDAFVAYINGVEIARNNIWNIGKPPYDAQASDEHEAAFYSCWSPDPFDCAEWYYVSEQILDSALVVGENVLSVQLHNYGLGMDDMSMVAVPVLGAVGPDTTFFSFPETSNLHTNFTLDHEGQRISLKDANGVAMDEFIIGEVHFNHSWGRFPDGAENWCLLEFPSPCGPNSSDCNVGYAKPPVIDLESGFYNGIQSVTMTSEKADDQIYYTMDGSTPNATSSIYSAPIAVSSSLTLRATTVAADPDYLPSEQSIRTYVIDDNSTLPVIFVTIDSVLLFDTLTGIYVIGPNTDTTVEAFPYWGSANYYQDWTVPGHVEYLDQDLKKQMGQDCAIEIHGNFSRGWPQKSFRFLANDKYGDGWFDFAPFPDKPNLSRMKSFNIRNGGVDYNTTHCRDGLMNRAVRDLNIDIMDHQPILMYLNGDYWGVYGLRERQNKHYIQSNYNIDPEFVNLLRFNGDPFHGSNTDYLALVDFIDLFDMSVDSNYSIAEAQLDVKNFTDYMIAETYYGNYDWINPNSETNNIKFWNHTLPGGKWRYILWDTDLGLNLIGAFGAGGNPVQYDYLGALMDLSYDDPHSTMLRGLLDNKEFHDNFINRFADIVNTTFSPEELGAMADEVYDEMEAEMDRHFGMWGAPAKLIFGAFWLGRSANITEWNSEFDTIYSFINNRPFYARNNVEALFDLTKQVNVTLDVDPVGAGEIHISTLDLEDYSYPWTGVYYDGVDIPISTRPNTGYRFSHWTSTNHFSSNDSGSFRINVDMDDSFIAHFVPIETAVIVNPNPFSDQLIVEYHLLEDAQVSLQLYDVSGRHVANLLDYSNFQTEGVNYITLDASQINLKAGAYVLEFITGDYQETKKLIKINEKK
jgi:hypothetical protein